MLTNLSLGLNIVTCSGKRLKSNSVSPRVTLLTSLTTLPGVRIKRFHVYKVR